MDKFERIVNEKLSKMSVYQKISQLRNKSRRLEKADIQKYDWWNEALHGVGRAGLATVFPQAIAMAATFDEQMIQKVGEIVSTEARAKYNAAQKNNDFSRYKGLTFWSPNINIYRDPRWGRGQEAYGEDPYLTSRMGVAYIKGLQGYDKEYLKVSACAKHYAVHSGPESERHRQNVEPTKRDLFETYLPAFEAAVKEGGVESVMSAYNAVYGDPCSCSRYLLQEILRKKWGFQGHVVSDCGAVGDICFTHKKALLPVKAAAMALNSGCDLECGALYSLIGAAYMLGWVKEETIDTSAKRLLMTRAKLGMFDKDCPYNNIGPEWISCKKHTDYSVEVAKKSLILLENNGILPLKPNQKIAVIGPNAKNERMLLGNYEGTPDSFITVWDGIRNSGMAKEVMYAKGCGLDYSHDDLLDEAVSIAGDADTIILCLGLDATMEGEEGDADRFDEKGNKLRGDRNTLQLPKHQLLLAEELLKTGKPVALLNFSGGACTFRGLNKKVDAFLQCWYPGAKGGKAVADILFGLDSPSGRLPVTFYQSDKDLPDFGDYSMRGRTYRYFENEVMYPFGYGLSYAKFKYGNLRCSLNEDTVELSVTVENSGDFSSEEVVQTYIKHLSVTVSAPRWSLKKINRIKLDANSSADIVISFNKKDLTYINDDGEAVINNGGIQFFIGGSSPDPAFFNGQSVIIDMNEYHRK